jgi:hypothetical protein
VTPKSRNRLIVILILAIPVAIFIGSILYSESHLPPPEPLPAVNGYDDLTKSAAMLTPDAGDYHTLSQDKLQAMVSKDSGALQEARAGMQEECRVPLVYSPTSHAVLVRHSGLLRLAQAFAAEGRLAEMQGRAADAANSYLDLIHLGIGSSRGGVLIDQLVGTAIEAMGASDLRELVPKLDAKTCRETAAALETFDGQRQTWGEVMQQEHDWARRTFPGVRYELLRLAERNSTKKIDQKAEQKFAEHLVKTRQSIIGLAARAYELDKGHPPASVADLTPDYLKTIPQDPLTSTNMAYLPQ